MTTNPTTLAALLAYHNQQTASPLSALFGHHNQQPVGPVEMFHNLFPMLVPGEQQPLPQFRTKQPGRTIRPVNDLWNASHGIA